MLKAALLELFNSLLQHRINNELFFKIATLDPLCHDLYQWLVALVLKMSSMASGSISFTNSQWTGVDEKQSFGLFYILDEK